MDKKIFIINGMGGSGKDSFVKFVQEYMGGTDIAVNFSSVDKVKKMAEFSGWEGGKTDKDRKYLSDLKALTDEYCDMSFADMHRVVKEFSDSEWAVALFIHIRESWNIKRAAEEFKAQTILVKNSNVTDITTNKSDADVYNYQYDYVIDNSGTLDDLRGKAREFTNLFIRGTEKAEETGTESVKQADIGNTKDMTKIKTIQNLIYEIKALEEENRQLREGTYKEADTTNRPIADLDDLAVYLCENLDCMNCPVFINNMDNRTRQEHMDRPCLMNIHDWLKRELGKGN